MNQVDTAQTGFITEMGQVRLRSGLIHNRIMVGMQEENVKTMAGKICQRAALSDDKVVLNCGHQLPVVMSVTCNNQRANNMPEHRGTVEGKPVTVLRHTGCSTVVVKKCLVEAEKIFRCVY